MPQILPKGHYGAGRFNEELRLNVHGSTVIYNKVRFVRRTPNTAGFMDIDHESPKPNGQRQASWSTVLKPREQMLLLSLVNSEN